MFDPNLINLIMILAGAAIGGAFALWLKQPIIIGYLIAGLLLGPFTPGPRADFDQFRFLIEIGIALLLFVLGTRMTPAKFRGLGRVILLGGFIQIVLTIGMGFLFLSWFNLSLAQGFLLGTILAQSSSAVIARVLDDRDETDSVHGRIAIGISAVQDLSSLPILMILLVFLRHESVTPISFTIAIGEVAALAVVVYVIGARVWPKLLGWFGRTGSEELTFIAALALALGGGYILHLIGLSFALGAFLAGVVIAESPQRSAAISRILPLRDVFAAIFFVSIGALFDPSVIWKMPFPLLGLLTALIVGKALIGSIVIRIMGQRPSTAILSGLLLAQIGEFAFIISNIALQQDAIPQQLFSLIIGAAVISILVNSLILDSAPPILAFLARITRFNALLKKPTISVIPYHFRRRPKENDVKPPDSRSKKSA